MDAKPQNNEIPARLQLMFLIPTFLLYKCSHCYCNVILQARTWWVAIPSPVTLISMFKKLSLLNSSDLVKYSYTEYSTLVTGYH